jgi:PAS domain S-box-containing protein
MYTWILVGALGAALVAIGFFVVTIFSLQDMLDVQRKTEDRLRENEEWLRAIIDNTRTLISVKGRDGRYVMMNQRFEHVLGVSALMAHGRRDDELFSPANAAALRADDERVVQRDDSVEVDRALMVAGEARRFYCVKTPLHDVTGNVNGVCMLAHDVTDRELAREERDRIFDLSLDMMVAGNFDGYLTLVNPQFEKFTGYTSEEVLSMPGMDLVHPDDRVDAAEALYALRNGRPVVDFRTRLRCKDGSYKRCQWRSMPAIEEGMIYSVGRPLEGSASDPVEQRSAEPGEALPKRTLTVARH